MISSNASLLTENGMFLMTIAVGITSSSPASPPAGVTPPGVVAPVDAIDWLRYDGGGGLLDSVGGERDRVSELDCSSQC